MADGVQPELVPSQPPDPYVRQFDFTNHEQTQPNKPVPGSKIDLELNEVRESLNDTIDRLNELQADDGSLRPGNISSQLDQKVAAAESARNDSVAAKVEAVAAKDQVLIAQGAVIGIANNQIQVAQGYVQDASLAAVDAQTSAGEAFGHMQTAENAKILAELARDNAQASAVTANDKRLLAEAASNTAQSHAANAYSQAQQAVQSAFNAAQSADLAGTSELDAASHAIAAAESAADAAASAAAANATTYAAPLSKTGNQVSIDPSYKPNPFDQSLNVGDPVSFGSVTITDLSANLTLNGGIVFSDATMQDTAGLSPADAAATYYPLTNPAGYISDVPAASTTVAGKVELATDAEAVAGASTTLAVTPNGTRWAIGNMVNSITTASAVANSGSTVSNIWDTFSLQCANLANSTARRWSSTYSSGFLSACIPGQPVYKVDFSKPFAIRWGIGLHAASSPNFEKVVLWVAQDTFHLSFTNDEAANIGFGCVLYPNGNLKISSRNASGVTSTTIASGIPMSRTTANNSPATEIVQVSDGLGNLFTYIDGALVDTRTSGPTTYSDVGTSPFALWGAGITSGATPTGVCTWTLCTPKVFFGRQ